MRRLILHLGCIVLLPIVALVVTCQLSRAQEKQCPDGFELVGEVCEFQWPGEDLEDAEVSDESDEATAQPAEAVGGGEETTTAQADDEAASEDVADRGTGQPGTDAAVPVAGEVTDRRVTSHWQERLLIDDDLLVVFDYTESMSIAPYQSLGKDPFNDARLTCAWLRAAGFDPATVVKTASELRVYENQRADSLGARLYGTPACADPAWEHLGVGRLDALERRVTELESAVLTIESSLSLFLEQVRLALGIVD